MSIAYPSPFPYLILLGVCLMITLICVAIFPSLRSLRRKRTLMIYAVLVAVFSLIGYQAYDVSLGPTWVSYSLNNDDRQFYAGRVNTLSVSLFNAGHRAGSVYLIIRSANASFSVYCQQAYPQSNASMLKIPFSFVQGEKTMATRLVQFTIDENVTTFSFHTHVEPQNEQPLITTFEMEMDGIWNQNTSSFSLYTLPTPV